MVGIGKRILKIDTIKVGKCGVFSADEPLRCPVDKLVDGVQLIGTHDGEVTDLSMCQWMTTRLVSASVDGTVRESFALFNSFSCFCNVIFQFFLKKELFDVGVLGIISI